MKAANRVAVLLISTSLWLSTAPAPVLANERLFLSGGETSEDDYYTYLGLIVPGPGQKNGKGWFQRYWIDRFGYEYDGGPGRIDARAWGGEAALGYVTPTSGGWWSASAGLRYTDTSLSPDDVNASARGGQASAKFQLELDQEVAADWRFGAIASYTLEQSQDWGRLRVTHRLSPQWSLAGEAVANGNDETDSIASGLVVIWQPPATSWTLGLKSGFRHQDTTDGVYAGIEIGTAF
jgi:hypothetical protein